MDKAFSFNVYDFTLTAGGSYRLPASGSYFRIMSATGAVNVTVEGRGKLTSMQAGQALQGVDFDALIIQDASGAGSTGQILVASAEFKDNRLNGTVDLSAASLQALESIDLNPTTRNILTRPLQYTSSYQSQASLAANTPEVVIPPADNLNGAILLRFHASNYPANGNLETLVAKATAPASIIDGKIVARASQLWPNGSATNIQSEIRVENPVLIPAGMGLYYIANAAMVGTMNLTRYGLYVLL